MDFQNYDIEPESPETHPEQPKNNESDQRPIWKNKRSDSMATASFVLGMISLLTSGCIYFALVCGALGIILALLSKGGEYTMNSQAKLGLVLSTLGLIFTIVIFVGMIAFTMYYYGGIDGVMQEYMNIMGAETMEELYEMMGITTY